MTERQIEEIVEIPEIGWSVASGQLTGASINPHPLGKPIIVSIETASHSQPMLIACGEQRLFLEPRNTQMPFHKVLQ